MLLQIGTKIIFNVNIMYKNMFAYYKQTFLQQRHTEKLVLNFDKF